MYQWFRLTFTDPYPSTDVWKYRRMSEMLVPWKGDTNRFRMVCTDQMTDFYIGSNGPESMALMKSFFKRLYSVKLDEATDQEETENFFLYALSARGEKKPRYAVSLIQNLSKINMISGKSMIVDLAIYHSGIQKAKVSMKIGTMDMNANLMPEKEYVRRIMKKFRVQTRVRSRRARKNVFYFSRPFFHTFLLNLIRIPEDEDPF